MKFLGGKRVSLRLSASLVRAPPFFRLCCWSVFSPSLAVSLPCVSGASPRRGRGGQEGVGKSGRRAQSQTHFPFPTFQLYLRLQLAHTSTCPARLVSSRERERLGEVECARSSREQPKEARTSSSSSSRSSSQSAHVQARAGGPVYGSTRTRGVRALLGPLQDLFDAAQPRALAEEVLSRRSPL